MGMKRKVNITKKTEGFYEKRFENKVTVRTAANKLIEANIPFNFYWAAATDGDDPQEASYCLSVGSQNRAHLEYIDISEDDMFDYICESYEKEFDGFGSGDNIHYFVREKLREIYELRNDDSLMDDFIEMKEGV